MTNVAKLEAELGRVRRNGWAEDRGEFSISVRALEAPVRDDSGAVVAAVSLAYWPSCTSGKARAFSRR